MSDENREYFQPIGDSYVHGMRLDARGSWAYQFLVVMIGNATAKDTSELLTRRDGHAYHDAEREDLIRSMVFSACSLAEELERQMHRRGWIKPPVGFSDYRLLRDIGTAHNTDNEEYRAWYADAVQRGLIRESVKEAPAESVFKDDVIIGEPSVLGACDGNHGVEPCNDPHCWRRPNPYIRQCAVPGCGTMLFNASSDQLFCAEHADGAVRL